MTRTGRRILLPSLLLLTLAVLLAAAVYYFVLYQAHAVTAELRVHHPQRLFSTQPDADFAGNSPEELELYAATTAELLRSRSVLMAALRSDKVKHLSVVKDQEDPENFLKNELRITRPTPAMIQVSLPCRKGGGQEYAVVVNTVVETFMNAAEKRDREAKSRRLQILRKIHEQLLDKLKRDMGELEAISATLGLVDVDLPTSAATNRHLVRRTEALIDALATEFARRKVSQLVDEDSDDDEQQEALKRLEAEYAKQTEILSEGLKEIAARSIPRKFVEVELKKRDIARLQQEVDQMAEAISHAKLDLETRGRIELISPATAGTVVNRKRD